MSTLVYAYGAKPPIENAGVVRDQMELAHRHYNDLIAAARRWREWREWILRQSADYDAAFRSVEAAEAALRDASDDDAPRRRAELKSAWSAHRTARKVAMDAYVEDVRALKQQWYAAVRDYRAKCGCRHGTYTLTEEAVDRSIATGREPKFRRWDGSGTVSVQVQGGVSVEELEAGTDTRVRVSGDGRTASLWLRVGSEGPRNLTPVWAVFPFVRHRPLPSDARVKRVSVFRRRVGTHEKWSVQFVLDLAAPAIASPSGGRTVAVDIGWRRLADGSLRVAVWRDNYGAAGECRVPPGLVARMAKVEDLRSIRDKLFNDARTALSAWLRTEEATRRNEYAEVLAEPSRTIHAWRAPAKLAALALRWRASVEAASGRELRCRCDRPGHVGTCPAEWAPAALHAVERWRKKDKHLYDWECHQRENVLRSRREVYRLFARDVARAGQVILEVFDLRKVAEEATGEPSGNRFLAAVSTLRSEIANQCAKSGATLTKVDAKHTTQQCATCGAIGINKRAAASGVVVTCSACGARADQDSNAAANLLAGGAVTGSGVVEPKPPKSVTARKRRHKAAGT